MHGSILSASADGTPVAVPTTNTANIEPFLVTMSNNSHTLNAYSPEQSSELSKTYCTLEGPSGKGIFHLQHAESTEPMGLGVQILFDRWKALSDGDALLLRYDDFAERGHWILEMRKTEDGKDVWTPWWLSPCAANMEDFESYVMVDIELVDFSQPIQKV